MGENINFIPATDLPVAEGEEVSVLCLENGAMKQKPAKGLGGSSAVVFRFVVHESNGDRQETIEPVPEGTFALLKSMFTEGVGVLTLWHEHGDATDENGQVLDWWDDIYPVELSYIYEPEGEGGNLPVSEFIIVNNSYFIIPDDRVMTGDEFNEFMGGGE